MNAVEHFANYLHRADRTRLKELTTIQVEGPSPFLAEVLTSILRDMVIAEITQRLNTRRAA